MLKQSDVIDACLLGIKHCDDALEYIYKKKSEAEAEGRSIGFYDTSIIRMNGIREGYGGILAWTLKQKDSESLRRKMKKHCIGDDCIVY